MKLVTAALTIVAVNSAFVPRTTKLVRKEIILNGYLDDLSQELYAEVDSPDVEATTKEATDLKKEDVDRFGVGNWETYRDFEDEFDGGDGQMGVAGDGNKKLEKFGRDSQPQLAKSKAMSAKNAWGRTTGYAETLIEKGVEEVRAQQIENWRNQREINQMKTEQKRMTEEFDKVTYEEDWRALSKFGVERNQEFDLNETFGEVTAADDFEEVIELSSRLGKLTMHQIDLCNEYMGFADFRAAWTPDTPAFFTVFPTEGSIQQKEATNFVIKFKPDNYGVHEGVLVIETEDFKKSWKFIGSTS